MKSCPLSHHKPNLCTLSLLCSSQFQVHEIQQSNPAQDPDPGQPGRVQYSGVVQEAGVAERHRDPGPGVRRHQRCSVHRLRLVRNPFISCVCAARLLSRTEKLIIMSVSF